jgi:hypothetical protein
MKRIGSEVIEFDGCILQRYISLEAIAQFLVNETNTLNYQFLLQFLLFLPSFSSPNDFLTLLIKCYKDISVSHRSNAGTVIIIIGNLYLI